MVDGLAHYVGKIGDTNIISNQFTIRVVFVYKHLNVKAVLFQAMHLCTNTQFSSIWPIDRNLLGTTIPGIGAMAMNGYSASDCLLLYCGGGGGGEFNSSAEKQSMYSTAPAD